MKVVLGILIGLFSFPVLYIIWGISVYGIWDNSFYNEQMAQKQRIMQLGQH